MKIACSQKMALGLVFLSAMCASRAVVIEPGVYTAPDGEQRILVSKQTIEFQLGGHARSASYDLHVNPDGRIQPYPLTSFDAALGIGRYDWWWDGSGIVRTDPKTNESLRFSRDRAPTPR